MGDGAIVLARSGATFAFMLNGKGSENKYVLLLKFQSILLDAMLMVVSGSYLLVQNTVLSRS